MNTLKSFSYQCEAAVLLPEHTAVAGRLLTAALRGHCFSETAAQSTFMDKLHFEDNFLEAANGKRPRILMLLLPAAGWCNQTSPLWVPNPSASENCSRTVVVPLQTPCDPL